MSADPGRRTWRIGYFVTVEVEARDATDAVIVGERATGWPGDWQPRHAPVEVIGELNGRPVKAAIIRSVAMMAYPKEDE